MNYRFRSVILGCSVAVAAIVMVVAMPHLLGRTEPVTRERLAAARKLWAEAQIASYDMDLETSGAETGRYHVEVRGGQLIHMSRNGQPANPGDGTYWTIDGLFRIIEEELDISEKPTGESPQRQKTWLRMRCDPKLGYPIKYIGQVPGRTTGVKIRVTRLEPKQER